MKKIFIPLAIIVLFFGSCGKKSSVKQANEKDSVAFFVGVFEGKGTKEKLEMYNLDDLDRQIIVEGYKKALFGDSIKYNEAKMGEKVNAYVEKAQILIANKNLKEGNEFLEKNKKNPAVVTLPDGLQYQELRKGSGPVPDSSSTVTVHFSTSLIDGEKLQSTLGQAPKKVSVLGFPRGFSEGLLKMNVGAKWKLFVPSQLAYGNNVRPQPGLKLKSNMVVIFEVELLNIEKQPEQTTKLLPDNKTKTLNKKK
jgi:FKBP-type peptidyl-prolyl cis-trans isomerase FklB